MMMMIMQVHAGMDLDDENDDHDDMQTFFTLETHSEAGAHRVKLRPERIPSLRLPRTPYVRVFETIIEWILFH